MANLPQEISEAIRWALSQEYELEPGVIVPVSVERPYTIVDKVREYFNKNNIPYESFSFDDLKPLLN